MSMSLEHVEEVKEKLAVTCCRIEEGIILGPENLEDPLIFPDLVDSGLLKIPHNNLKVKQVLGAKLLKTVDSLTPLTPDLLEGIIPDNSPTVSAAASSNTSTNPEDWAILKIAKKAGETIQSRDLEDPQNIEKLVDSLLLSLDGVLKIKDVLDKTLIVDLPALTGLKHSHFSLDHARGHQQYGGKHHHSGMLKIHIAEGKGIHIEMPLGTSENLNMECMERHHVRENTIPESQLASTSSPSPLGSLEDRKIRSLSKKHFRVDRVIFGKETKLEGTTLTIRENIIQDLHHPLVVKVHLDIITPDQYKTYSETLMDVQPISTKEGESKLGTGISRVLDGVVILVTGTDEKGVQIGEFGSSEGILEENILWGRPGAPDKGDIIIRTNVTIKEGTNMERPGPLAAHTVTDKITQEIRMALKQADESLAIQSEELVQYRRPSKKKILVVKEIMGQGAMHDNLILPIEPIGVLGGQPNVDLGNLPIVFSPLEVLDGGVHALTCIGPASKETSRHYYREPLVIEAMKDEDVDLCGIVFVGSPQINNEKFYVSERLGMLVEAMDIDGAIVTTEGFGNNHIDFASHIEQIGMRGIPVVGVSYCALQGALVVGNKYMTHMVDNNKSEEGIENEILACNTLCLEDALRSLAMLKTSMAGGQVAEAERKWNPHVKESNLEILEKGLHTTIPRSKTI